MVVGGGAAEEEDTRLEYSRDAFDSEFGVMKSREIIRYPFV